MGALTYRRDVAVEPLPARLNPSFLVQQWTVSGAKKPKQSTRRQSERPPTATARRTSLAVRPSRLNLAHKGEPWP